MSIAISVVARRPTSPPKQPEAAIDVAGENLKELIDDAGAGHGSLAFRRGTDG